MTVGPQRLGGTADTHTHLPLINKTLWGLAHQTSRLMCVTSCQGAGLKLNTRADRVSITLPLCAGKKENSYLNVSQCELCYVVYVSTENHGPSLREKKIGLLLIMGMH